MGFHSHPVDYFFDRKGKNARISITRNHFEIRAAPSL
jgi:hypothetical protein